MTRLNARLCLELPNLLTLLRVVLASLFNLYIISHFGDLAVPVIIFLLIILTDFLDGKVARLWGNTSSFGAVFDVLADLFYILLSSIVLCYFQLLPLWFIFLMFFKFVEFVGTSFLLKKMGTRKSTFVFDMLGRCAAVLFYIIPIVVYVSNQISIPVYYFTVHSFVSITVLMVFASSLNRLWNCAQQLHVRVINEL